ncbi:phosphatidate cytidylyltransferase [Candidatus Tachikawaea gelatinosa]|uniref:Phosphatidate cytidylyltransferase n=2 Tax=Candidatus Tachikawaea gelatinosa TaxID=1410383 RepID=A0A090ALA4_9ENTR|nr:phosphatidate cytidylyltransferase [Candidatus Tachikawaea gelatinosa]
MVFLFYIIAVFEWIKLIQVNHLTKKITLLMLDIFLFVLIAFLLLNSNLKIFYIQFLFIVMFFWLFFLVYLVVFYPYSIHFLKKSYLAKNFFGCLIIIPLFISIIKLRFLHYEYDNFFGFWKLFFIFSLVWATDSGAYFFGKFFGKHSFFKRISPKKTLEGFIGGIISSIFIMYSFVYVFPFSINFLKFPIFYAIVIAFFSTLGDLIESMFKREAQIKDSGKIFPGHGGVLDRIDSLTLSVPFFTCLTFFNESF